MDVKDESFLSGKLFSFYTNYWFIVLIHVSFKLTICLLIHIHKSFLLLTYFASNWSDQQIIQTCVASCCSLIGRNAQSVNLRVGAVLLEGAVLYTLSGLHTFSTHIT